jgi:hypothetical protein
LLAEGLANGVRWIGNGFVLEVIGWFEMFYNLNAVPHYCLPTRLARANLDATSKTAHQHRKLKESTGLRVEPVIENSAFADKLNS